MAVAKGKSKKAASKGAAKPAIIKLPPKGVISLADYYAEKLGAINKKHNITGGSAYAVDPLSTGLLVVDLIQSGGVFPIMSQFSGQEQSGKTTLCICILGNAHKSGVPIVGYTDAEGSMIPEYANNVLRGFGIEDIFNNPHYNYWDTETLEDFAGQTSDFLKLFPAKRWIDETESWAYVLPKGKKTTTTWMKAAEAVGLKAEKTLSKDENWVVPTEYAGLEALLFIDSWPALLPEKVDEEGPSNQMAGNATPLGKQLPRFAGKLKRRGVGLVSVNQMRENPGVRYGSPFYEPGGNALKHYAGQRAQLFQRAVPQGWERDPDSSNLGIEDSAHGEGYDRYAYKFIQNTKNKMGRPFMKGMVRVWVSDAEGEARGFDPVFDTWSFLQMTGQLNGNRKKATLALRSGTKGSIKQLEELPFSYEQFKQIVVAEHFSDRELLKEVAKVVGLKKAPKLREALFQQLKTDKGLWSDLVDTGDDTDEEQEDEE